MFHYLFDPLIYQSKTIHEFRKRVLRSLGTVIRLQRQRKSESQEMLGKALGVTKSMISRYENGESEIPASILPIISDRYNIKMSDLLKETGKKGATTPYEELNSMVLSIVNSMEKNDDIFSRACIIANYYAELIYPNTTKSFDMYFIMLQLKEEINKIIENKDFQNEESQKNIHTVINLFTENLKRMSNNDYSKNPSVFYEELNKKLRNKESDPPSQSLFSDCPKVCVNLPTDIR